MFVAAGTPPAVVNSLNEALNKVLARPEVRDEIEALGFWVVGGTAEAHGEWLGREIARVQEMARRLRAQGSDMRW